MASTNGIDDVNYEFDQVYEMMNLVDESETKANVLKALLERDLTIGFVFGEPDYDNEHQVYAYQKLLRNKDYRIFYIQAKGVYITQVIPKYLVAPM